MSIDFDGTCRDCGDDLSAAYDEAALCYACLLKRYKAASSETPVTAKLVERLGEYRLAPDFKGCDRVAVWMTGEEAAAFLRENGAAKAE